MDLAYFGLGFSAAVGCNEGNMRVALVLGVFTENNTLLSVYLYKRCNS